MNNWLRSELDCPYYCNQTPIDILIKLSSTEDNVFVFHILNFFTVNYFLYIFINNVF